MSHAEPLFDPDRLQAIPVARYERHAELGSTSDRALTVAADPAVPLPLLVLAERQTAGRGRGANRWWAEPGALTFSLALSAEHVPRPRWPQLALVVGLAVGSVLERLAPHALVGLKWPNDVHLAGRKVCGVLIESIPARPGAFVVGIGLNVNNSLAAAPAEIAAVAISLCDVAGMPFDLPDVLAQVIRQVLARWADFAGADAFAPLAREWNRYCVLTGRTVQVDAGGRQITGLCRGIDEDGALLLVTETGPERIIAGSVLRW